LDEESTPYEVDMKKYLLCFVMFVMSNFVMAHPDNATPYWYPSEFIYGYINGCFEATELNQVPFTENMWPDDVKRVCACVVDAMRHSMSHEKMLDNAAHNEAVLIAISTLPVCVDEVMASKVDKSEN
jgi:hypothetical protein